MKLLKTFSFFTVSFVLFLALPLFISTFSVPVLTAEADQSQIVTPTPTPQRQIVFVHGIKTSFRDIKNGTGGFQSLLIELPNHNYNINFFQYYQDLGYQNQNGNGCDSQPAPDTNISPLYAPSSNNTNKAIDPKTCDSQSAIAYNSTGLYNFISTLSSPVAIINYSMGAPITRGWLTLAQNRQNDQTLNIVDTIISIQGVQQGSYITLGALPILKAANWSSPLLAAVIFGVQQLTGWNKDRPAEADLTPKSPWYQSTLPVNVPLRLHYYNFYSDIKVSARPQLFFRVWPSIGSTSLGDAVILPGNSNSTAMPLLGGARFFPKGPGLDSHEYALSSNHDLLLGNDLLNPLQKGSVLGVGTDVINDPINHVNLNKHLNDNNDAYKVDSCRSIDGKVTIQQEILHILANPVEACPGET